MTGYQKHEAGWHDCMRCPLHEGRTRVVLARGSLPCDVLFIGEAPGASEDLLGRPFAGPAGHLLDKVIERAVTCHNAELMNIRTAFTNLVACIPLGEDGAKTAEPEPEDILACAPRLRELVVLAKPRLIVSVGGLAEAWVQGRGKAKTLLPDYRGRHAAIVHPAAILRANVAQQGLMIQRAVVKLAAALEDL